MKLSYRTALSILLLSSAAVVIAAGRTWVKVWFEDPGMPVVSITLSGSQLQPVISGLGAAAVAAVLGIMATKGLARRIIGAVVALLGIGILYSALRLKATISSHVSPAITEAVGRNVDSFEFSFNNLVWVPVIGGFGVIVSGAVFLLRDFASSKMSGRYERKRTSTDELSPWQSLDNGIDPTIQGQ